MLTSGRVKCVQNPNCCYWQQYEDLYETHVSKCQSIDVFINYTVVNQTAYLKRLGLTNYYNRLSNRSFCEIITSDPDRQDVRSCQCLVSQTPMVGRLLSVGFALLVVLGLGVMVRV